MSPGVSADVAVIGGGVVGAACARGAARRGLETVIFEAGPDPGAASPASAGMLAAQIEPDDKAFLSLAIRGRETYEPLALALKDSTGLDIGFWRDGIASLAFGDGGVERLREMAAFQRQMGLSCSWLDAPEVHERWPGVSRESRGALLASEDGAVDPPALTAALLSDGARLGVRTIRQRVMGITRSGSAAVGVTTAQGTTAVKEVIVAAGAWAPQIGGLPRTLPVVPMRGQMALLPWPEGTPPAILYVDHSYVLARGGNAVIGSTMEAVGFDNRTTDQGLAEIRRGATRIFPALADVPFGRSWAGLRPVTPDGRPIIGPDPEVTHLWYAAGHGRNGILLAALTGDIIGDLILGKDLDFDLTPFGIERFLGSANQPNG